MEVLKWDNYNLRLFEEKIAVVLPNSSRCFFKIVQIPKCFVQKIRGFCWFVNWLIYLYLYDVELLCFLLDCNVYALRLYQTVIGEKV